ncbi:unnamed protein product, partial [Staurois parvus]
MTERGQCMLKHTVHRNRQLSAESIAKDLQTYGLQISTTTVSRELHGMGFHGKQLHPSLTSPSAMQSVGCSGVKHANTGLYSSGDMFSTVTNQASLSGNPKDVSGFGGYQENGTC